MQRRPDRLNPAALGRLRLQLRGLLRPARAVGRARQGAGQGAAGGDCPLPGIATDQGGARLRQPDQGETGLSVDEIMHGVRIGVIALEG
ncbi:MAG: hypothetical protein ACRECD_01210 [Burkholderiaceae bacterium]